ncbi:MAG: P1 family peptidase [Acidobacteriia bacterium]|nr:P1 family peptidase [Terriglobia bacterium]
MTDSKMFNRAVSIATVLLFLTSAHPVFSQSAPGSSVQATRPRARSLGIHPGIYEPGKLNAITDVKGVRVGQVTRVEGENVRTGVTAIFPTPDNPFKNKLAAAIVVGNGFGKLIGFTQVNELGEMETPIVLTNTLSVWTAADAVVDYMLSLPGNEDVRSINPIVGETNDGYLNDIRGRHILKQDVLEALRSAKDGPLEEGSVGAGAGTVAFQWKGGIGTSSRLLPRGESRYTLGALVQTNFGGHLTIDGVPIWQELKPQAAIRQPSQPGSPTKVPAPTTISESVSSADGSCMIVLATDAPLDARQLTRLARRAFAGMARTGSTFSNGSGDYVIAFSTAPEFLSASGKASITARVTLHDDDLSPFFEAAEDATEEAIYNSLLQAATVHGRDGHVAEAIPIGALNHILNKFGRGSEQPLDH